MGKHVKVTEKQVEEIIKLYKQGKTQKEIGAFYNMSRAGIGYILNKYNIKTKSGHFERKLTKDQEKKLIKRYIEGESTKVLTKEYGMTSSGIWFLLKRAGITRERIARRSSNVIRFTKEEEKDIIAKYFSGETQKNIAKRFKACPKSIQKILIKNNIKIRPRGGNRKRRFSPEIEKQICKDYEDGMDQYEIGEKYKAASSFISSIIKRNGIKARTKNWGMNRRAKIFSPEYHDEIVDNYCHGFYVWQLQDMYGISKWHVEHILQEKGIELNKMKGYNPHIENKKCYICNEYKPINEFLDDPNKPGGKKPLCNDPSCILTAQIKPAYGITANDYYNLLHKQEGRCAICGKAVESKAKRLYIDHDHNTEKMRGLLCPTCNWLLGNFKDTITNLKNAALYLEKMKNHMNRPLFMYIPPQFPTKPDTSSLLMNMNLYSYFSMNALSRNVKGLKNYGMDLDHYLYIIDKQHGCCAICGESFCTLVVDHDHSSEERDPICVRGLLCRKCNLGLGNCYENSVILQSTIAYLRKYECQKTK